MSGIVTDELLAKKIAALDKRDKRLRQRMVSQNSMNKSQTYTGSCNDMCPERERYLRLGFHLSTFEKDENNQPDEYAMVKEYRRAGADQEEPLPHDLRTLKALETTMDYLVCNIMDSPKSKSAEHALEWYDFLWDRLRAIRKDITQQNICDQPSATLVERCARFHVHTCYALNRVKGFDVVMDKKNLNDCLQMLRQMYTDLKSIGTCCPGEVEFQKYDILLHLDDDHSSINVSMKTSEHRCSKEMKFVTEVFYAYTNYDYYRFFKLAEQADYMTSCILSLYINKMRLRALRMIIAACPPRQTVYYPANLIIDSLGFDDMGDLTEFAQQLDIEMQLKDGKHHLLFHKELANLIRQSGTELTTIKSFRLVESKVHTSGVGQLIYGLNKLPQNPYRMFPLTCIDDSELGEAMMTNQPEEEDDFQEMIGIDEEMSEEVEEVYEAPSRHGYEQEEYGEEEEEDEEQEEEENEEREDEEGDVDDEQDELEEHQEDQEHAEEEQEGKGIEEEIKQEKAEVDQKKQDNIEDEQEIIEVTSLKNDETSAQEEIVEVEAVEEERTTFKSPQLQVQDTDIPLELTEKSSDIAVVVDEAATVDYNDDLEDGAVAETVTTILPRHTFEEVRDMMPAGRFKRCRLSSKVPKLSLPIQVQQEQSPIIKKRRRSSIIETLHDINATLQDEKDANARLYKLASLYLEN